MRGVEVDERDQPASTKDTVVRGYVAVTDHLDRLPGTDLASRAIVAQMKSDESAHAIAAERAGAAPLPWPARMAMRLAGSVMTKTAHYL